MNDLVPMSSLAERWGVVANTVSRRLSRLNIKPQRKGNYRYITTSELAVADKLHYHLLHGGSMDSFCQFSSTSGYIERYHNERVSKSLRYAVLERDGHRCQACGATSQTHKLEVDHIHPVKFGGTSTLSNLRTLCQDCNRGKGAKVTPSCSRNFKSNAKLLDDKEGVSLLEWRNRHELCKSTAYAIVRIAGVKSTRLRTPESRSPVAFFSADQVRILDKIVAKFRAGQSLLSLQNEANEDQQRSMTDQGHESFLVARYSSFVEQFRELCRLNSREQKISEKEFEDQAFRDLATWYAMNRASNPFP